MTMAPLPAVTLTPVAYFPEGYFPENLAVRADGSVLVTMLQGGRKELWCVPGPEPRAEVRPVLVHTFENLILGIAEAESDVLDPPRSRRLSPTFAPTVHGFYNVLLTYGPLMRRDPTATSSRWGRRPTETEGRWARTHLHCGAKTCGSGGSGTAAESTEELWRRHSVHHRRSSPDKISI